MMRHCDVCGTSLADATNWKWKRHLESKNHQWFVSARQQRRNAQEAAAAAVAVAAAAVVVADTTQPRVERPLESPASAPDSLSACDVAMASEDVAFADGDPLPVMPAAPIIDDETKSSGYVDADSVESCMALLSRSCPSRVTVRPLEDFTGFVSQLYAVQNLQPLKDNPQFEVLFNFFRALLLPLFPLSIVDLVGFHVVGFVMDIDVWL